MQVYFSLLNSSLDYAAPLFLNATSKNHDNIERYIRRAHKIICDATCANECIPNLLKRKRQRSLAWFTNIVKDPEHLLFHLLPIKSSRSNRLILPTSTSDKRFKSFEIACAIDYNKHLV